MHIVFAVGRRESLIGERWEEELHSYLAGAFSYSKSMVPAVVKYINNQKEHHRRVTFQEELADIFEKMGIEYVPAYMMEGVVEVTSKNII